MKQAIELSEYTSVEVSGQDYTTLKINDLYKYTLILELDNDLADEIAGKIYKKIHGYYPEDKISEHEHEMDELKRERDNLQELLDEAVL